MPSWDPPGTGTPPAASSYQPPAEYRGPQAPSEQTPRPYDPAAQSPPGGYDPAAQSPPGQTGFRPPPTWGPPGGPPPGGGGGGNKKALIGLLAALAALVLIAALVLVYFFVIRGDHTTTTANTSTSTPTSKNRSSTSRTSPSNSSETEPPPSAPGGAVTDGDVTFSSTGTETATGITVEGVDVGTPSNGEYFVVHLSATNNGTSSSTIVPSMQKLHAGATTYSGDDIGSAFVNGDVPTIEPGKELEFSVVFDVPPDTSGDSIELDSDFVNGGVELPLS